MLRRLVEVRRCLRMSWIALAHFPSWKSKVASPLAVMASQDLESILLAAPNRLEVWANQGED